MQPLSGVRVLDLTTLLPGPLATLMLAEAGAEVIKIERPGGDDLRHYGPMAGEHGAAYAMLNRGKTILDLDLKNEEDRARLDPLLDRADVLIEQFCPGVMDRLGLGYESVRRRNPRIVYCSITGYGQSGPRRDLPGHDLNYVGTTGLLALQPGPPDRPTLPPAQIADIAGGTFPAVINILLGLRQRDATGKGCFLDIAMADAMFTFAWHALATGFGGGRFPDAGELLLAGGSPRYQVYPTRDGGFAACAPLEDKFWHAFTAAIGLPQSLVDDRKDPVATQAAIAALIAQKTAAEWEPIFAATACCANMVQSLEEALGDPHFVARGLFASTLTPLAGPNLPPLPVPIAPAFRAARPV